MGRKKKRANIDEARQELALQQINTRELQAEYEHELDTNPKYSLDVDPENKYSLSDSQKDFIKYYVNFKNINTAADLCGIDMDTAKAFFISYPTQTEVRRINLAMYHRQFQQRLVSLDEIGGYLTSLLVDDVPYADRLKTTEKLRIVELLIRLNEMKQNAMLDPSALMEKDLDAEIQSLSVITIKQLLKTSEKVKNKTHIVSDINAEDAKKADDAINNTDLTPEEQAYLSTLSTKDILTLLNDTNEAGGKNE